MKPHVIVPLLAALMAAPCGAAPGRAGTIVDDWARVAVPPAPELKPARLDARTTALLVLDFNGHEEAASGPCNAATKPRCLATIPAVAGLLARARAAGVAVVHSTSANGTPADIRPGVAPAPGEPVVKAGPDKFIGTDLADILAKRGARTLVIVGTAAEGAVLDTGTDAALHGFDLVVPVDGLSSTEPYAEQYVAWHLAHAPGVAARTTLTRIDAVAF